VPAGTRKTPVRTCCARKAQERYRAAEHPAFPARWFDGLCALSSETSSFCLRHLREMHVTASVDTMTPSQRLDRSDDGQDHTVSPYASNPASPRGLRRTRRRSYNAAASGSRGSAQSTAPPCHSHPRRRRPRPPQSLPAFVTTYDRPFGGLGWPTHTTNPNFGKVEYFCREGLTALSRVLP
jgi:hypothetical protein